MAQNVTVQGASYADVPAVVLPKTGGGTASFTDVSDTTAAAGDVASGKYFYTAAGQRTEGTASGGGGYTDLEILSGDAPAGEVILNLTSALPSYSISGRTSITQLTINYPPTLTTMNQSVISYNSGLDKIIINGYHGNLNNYHISNNTTGGVKEVYLRGFFGNLNANALRNNNLLAIVDLDEAAQIANNVFWNDAALTTLILRRTSICPLLYTNSFDGTPFKNGGTGGTIYIPKTLYDHLGDGTSNDYKHATNWATIDGYGTITWAKIEGSIYE